MNLTGVFKIHNPSARKRTIMDHAIREYTLAYQALLDWAREHEAMLEQEGMFRDKFNGRAIARLLPLPDVALHGSAKGSLKTDVAGNLASYFALKAEGATVTFPTARDPHPAAYPNALGQFVGVGSSKDDYDMSRDKLMTLARGQFMPMYFAGADGASRNRLFSLLAHTTKRQLLAALWLLPARHDLGQPLGAKDGDLFRVDTGEVFTSNSSCAILAPLEVGRNGWQEERFLQPALNDKAAVKVAFLIKRDDEYYLNVVFDVECPAKYEPQAHLGIDKGILFTAAYATIDLNGDVLTIGHFDDELRALQIKHGRERERKARNGQRITKRDYKRKAYDNILHCLANDLIAMAQKHQAGIVVEDLNVRVRGGRVVSRFRKLDRILDYKCELAGVPFRRVFAAYSSVICHRCGEDLERDDRRVECASCGYVGHSDDNAAVNIARRALYRKADWKGGYREFHRSFGLCTLTSG
jgi:putative transposase